MELSPVIVELRRFVINTPLRVTFETVLRKLKETSYPNWPLLQNWHSFTSPS